jgi:hypothetical protein
LVRSPADRAACGRLNAGFCRAHGRPMRVRSRPS